MMQRGLLAAISLLAGCVAAPTRVSSPEDFKLTFSGQVKPGSMQAMTDCVMDGFDASSFVLTSVNVRQQRRVAGYRVDLLGGVIIVASADILDSGGVEFHESSSAALMNITKEREAVAACVAKFQ